MKINENKLNKMVDAAFKAHIKTHKTTETHSLLVQVANGELTAKKMVFRDALIPFCMDYTEDEIQKEIDERSRLMEGWYYYDLGFWDAINFAKNESE